MLTRDSLYDIVRESLPRADKNLVDALISEIEKKSKNLPVEQNNERRIIERTIKLLEFRALGVIDV